jgi:hypothetical protein
MVSVEPKPFTVTTGTMTLERTKASARQLATDHNARLFRLFGLDHMDDASQQLMADGFAANLRAIDDAPDFAGLLRFVHRSNGPALLFDAFYFGEIGDAELRAVVPDVWSAAERPQHSLGCGQWCSMFRQCGYYSGPALRLYRGAASRYGRRMAWTSDLERARWFAGRSVSFTGRAAFVYQTGAPADAILCDVDAIDGGRGEKEFIVDPRTLLITRLERVTEPIG